MTINISELDLISAIESLDDIKLNESTNEFRTKLLFKLKDLREYFLAEPEVGYSSLLVDGYVLKIPFKLNDDDYNFNLHLEVDFMMDYDPEIDELMLSLSRNAFRVTNIDLVDYFAQETIDLITVDHLSPSAYAENNRYELSALLYNRMQVQPMYEAVDYISTCLRYLTPITPPKP